MINNSMVKVDIIIKPHAIFQRFKFSSKNLFSSLCKLAIVAREALSCSFSSFKDALLLSLDIFMYDSGRAVIGQLLKKLCRRKMAPRNCADERRLCGKC
jgi:hypothetical protein